MKYNARPRLVKWQTDSPASMTIESKKPTANRLSTNQTACFRSKDPWPPQPQYPAAQPCVTWGSASQHCSSMTQASLGLTPPPAYLCASDISRLALHRRPSLYKAPTTKARGSQTLEILDPPPHALSIHSLSLVALAQLQDSTASMPTWKSGSTGSTRSKASTLFGLEEEDGASILVYRYRSGCKALEVSTQRDLCRELDNGELVVFAHASSGSLTRGRLQTPSCLSRASQRSPFPGATAGSRSAPRTCFCLRNSRSTATGPPCTPRLPTSP